MGGRVKRIAGLTEAAARLARESAEISCGLCGRLLGRHIEWHHVVPKSEGGTQTVPVHPICHRTIHAFVANRELATSYPTMNDLCERDDVRRYLRWIADKSPDFYAPTRQTKVSRPLPSAYPVQMSGENVSSATPGRKSGVSNIITESCDAVD
jgi:hypothetical protein